VDFDAARDDEFEAATADRFRWTPLADLRALRLVPGFLADAVFDLPPTPRRVVREDFRR